MTSSKESSDRIQPAGTLGGIETLGGVVHPFDIEVQDFDAYALVLDVRERSDFEQDHVPGAICVSPQAVSVAMSHGASLAAEPSTAADHYVLQGRLDGLAPGALILVYCGAGGRDSLPLARWLKAKGWRVDVLPGGWINYRRWVVAGLDVLLRLAEFRVLRSAYPMGSRLAIDALLQLGHQGMDLQALAERAGEGWSPIHGASPQAYFESLLLQALRGMDAQRPVWVAAWAKAPFGLLVPATLQAALERAPWARLVLGSAAEPGEGFGMDAGPAVSDSDAGGMGPRLADLLAPSLEPAALNAAVDAWLKSQSSENASRT